MPRIVIPSGWTPIPHTLIADARISDSAVRLYALLHKLGWDRRDITDIHDLASCWPTPPDERPPTPRSIYRWLGQLEGAGWLSYERKPGQRGLGDRINVHPQPLKNEQSADDPPPQPLTPESHPRPKPLTPESEDGGQPLTPESELLQTSDTRVTTSDTRVRGRAVLPHQNATKKATQISGQILTRSDPPPPHETSIGGGGGAPESHDDPTPKRPARSPQPQPDPDTLRLLNTCNVSAKVRRELGHVPAWVAEITLARIRQSGRVQSEAGALVTELRAWVAEQKEADHEPRPVGSWAGRGGLVEAHPPIADDAPASPSPEQLAAAKQAARDLLAAYQRK